MSLRHASSRLHEQEDFAWPEEETRSDQSTVVLPRESLAPIRRARSINGQGTPERAERVRDELLRGLAYETAVEPDAPASGSSLSPSGYDPESTPPLWPLKPRSLTVRKPRAVDDDDETPPSTPVQALEEHARSSKSAVAAPWPRFARPEIEDITTAERDIGTILPSAPRGGMAQSGYRRKSIEPTPAPQGEASPLATALVAGAFVTGAGLAVFICVLLHVF